MKPANFITGLLAKVPVSKKFRSDSLWNFYSVIILGVSGLVLNILIGRIYGADILGVFNQVFAVYIFLSQIATFGIHIAGVKYAAEFIEDKEELNRIFTSAVILVIIIGIAICFIGWVSAGAIADFLQSSDFRIALICALPGLFFFSLNKVLLGLINGIRMMKAYACFMSTRYLLLLISFVLLVLWGEDGKVLPVIFTITEVTLCICIFIYVLRVFRFVRLNVIKKWLRDIFNFGLRAFSSAVLTDMNTRIDVIMLGYFCSDRIVGIYSCAAIIVEGIAQLTFVLRINMNPILTRLSKTGDWQEIKNIIHKGKMMFYPFMVFVGIFAVLLYPLFIKYVMVSADFIKSFPVFIILLGGFIISSGYLPFNMTLVQAGMPGTHTLLIFLTATTNALLNMFLIYFWGLNGAAIATSLAYISGVFYLIFLVKKKFNIWI